jgi:hypothetical protein
MAPTTRSEIGSSKASPSDHGFAADLQPRPGFTTIFRLVIIRFDKATLQCSLPSQLALDSSGDRSFSLPRFQRIGCGDETNEPAIDVECSDAQLQNAISTA